VHRSRAFRVRGGCLRASTRGEKSVNSNDPSPQRERFAMSQHPVHVTFPGRLVMLGFGSIGQGVLPLILRHVGISTDRITIVTADDRGCREAAEYGIKFIEQPLTRENYAQVLRPLLGTGDFLLNLSVDVSSVALIKLCHEIGALYLDTCIEPWPGGYTDPNVSPALRTNYALREEALAVRQTHKNGPTAVLTHGANPGLVSHFVKQALLNIAADTGVNVSTPSSREEWASLAQQLGIKVIHIAERDTQVANVPKRPGEFVNTWSVDGFVGEGSQPSELGWGTHEKWMPENARLHDFGCKCAAYLMQPGASTRVRTWTPKAGTFHGFLITHGESISISDYLTIRKGDEVVYRPTVHYAYHPCDDAVLSVHELAGRNWRMQEKQRILNEEIIDGIDELGVLLAGHKRNAYWYGSQLSIDEARKLVPYNTATSLQVCVAVLSGLIWAIENPDRGITEPDEMDFRRNLEICMPYLGPVVGEYTQWTPLYDRGWLFPEPIDPSDPWQFRNVLV
jgi:homospermidine synthase